MIYNLRKLPNILNIYFPNQNSQDLLMKLDLNGVAISAGSACSGRTAKTSHILKALGLPEKKLKAVCVSVLENSQIKKKLINL